MIKNFHQNFKIKFMRGFFPFFSRRLKFFFEFIILKSTFNSQVNLSYTFKYCPTLRLNYQLYNLIKVLISKFY